MKTTESPPPAFTPVAVRRRHDGWTPDKQSAFIEALGECGCVVEAARRVGMSAEGAYALRRRVDANSFRMAWDKALDYAIRRLSDAVYSRAIHGIPVPHFYKGEQVGEHRRYDERLAMFLLRYRDPLHYAKTLDEFIFRGHPEAYALKLARAVDELANDAWDRELGIPPRGPGAAPDAEAEDDDWPEDGVSPPDVPRSS